MGEGQNSKMMVLTCVQSKSPLFTSITFFKKGKKWALMHSLQSQWPSWFFDSPAAPLRPKHGILINLKPSGSQITLNQSKVPDNYWLSCQSGARKTFKRSIYLKLLQIETPGSLSSGKGDFANVLIISRKLFIKPDPVFYPDG